MIGQLLSRSSIGCQIFFLLASLIDVKNQVSISEQRIADCLGVSLRHVKRGIAFLGEYNFLSQKKIGTANIYILNPEVIWTGYSTQKRNCDYQPQGDSGDVQSYIVRRNELKSKARSVRAVS